MAKRPTNSAWEEFCAFCEEFGGATFSVAAQERIGLEMVAQLRHQGLNGCLQSQKILLEHWRGQPVQTISSRVGELTDDEAREELIKHAVQRYLRRGYSEADARAMAEQEYGDDE